MDRVLQLETCQVDLDRRMVIREDAKKRLTEQETALLEYLAARPGTPVSRDELLVEVWGFTGKNLITRAVDVAVRRLRKKVERDPASPVHVLTVRHVGYRFEPEVGEVGPSETPVAAPQRRPPPTPAPIPVERTTFIGRETDLEALKALSNQPRALVTVIGPPGVGKTRIAVQLGHAVEGASEGEGMPVAFVDAAPAQGAADLVQRVADVLGLPLLAEAEVEARSLQLGRALADRGPLLLILDNLEQLVTESEHVARWLDLAPQLRVVVTSRERLRLPGEHVVSLDPLDTDDAVALFLDRAQALTRNYGADDPDVIERIVEDLDGIPLAIELAAARARVLPPRALLEGLQQRFRILGGAARGTSPNRATLHGALDWSWSLLTDHEQAALAQLAVFEATFTVADADAVVDLSAHPDAPWVLDWLQGLVDRSMVRAVERNDSAHFELLRSQRAFAWERLDKAGQTESTKARHRDHVLAVGEQKVEALHGPRGKEALAELKLLADDVRAVHRRSVDTGDARAIIRSAEVLDALVEITGPLAERVQAIDAALKVAAEPRDTARLLLARARIRSVQALQDSALEDAERVIEMATELDDRSLLARAVGHKAWMLELQGKYAETRAEAQRSLKLAEEAGDRLAEAWAHNRLGHVHAVLDELTLAEEHYRKMRAISQELGSWRLELRARHTLGFVARSANRFQEAEREYRTALELVRDAGDPVREATLLGNLATLASARGDLDQALELFQESLQLHRSTGNRRLEILALGNTGILLMAVGRLREARSRLVDATALADERDSKRHLGMMEGNLGLCQVQLGEIDEARAHLERAIGILSSWGTPFTVAYFSLHLAIVLADLDEPAGSEASLERAVEGLGEHPIADALVVVARAHLHLARGREAKRTGTSPAPHREQFEQALERAERAAADTRDVALANAMNAVLPSELQAALRNLRRTAIDRRL